MERRSTNKELASGLAIHLGYRMNESEHCSDAMELDPELRVHH